ncbi:MAG: hypothetical protein M0R30_07055 [Methanoregula sp.]|jgi:hypothetical protein|uniref:hypothetical protein n=1 Tax=Methanoregula sp. TaxID=2052170 RepID=UPI0025DBB8CB|nr:hypothetical protein [Methanoregula sp.]MCK9631386.1 hypothetical protein [Methanoregula sp.]
MTEETCNTRREDSREQMDAIQRFFVRPFFLSCTIGIPFCLFKILFGLSALREGMHGGEYLWFFGMVVTVWAVADLLMNTSRSALDLLHRQAPFEYCTIAQLGRVFGRPLIFLAFDTLLTFAIISAMLWTGWIATLSPAESWLWYGATTMNLISLSLVSLYNEVRRGNT